MKCTGCLCIPSPAVLQNDAQQLHIVDLAYFIAESAQVSEVVDQAEGTAFAGFANQEDQGVEEMKGQEDHQEQNESTEYPDYDSESDSHWWWLHFRLMNKDISNY